MKLLGIDYGSKRVGVAITDAEGRVAFPKMTLPNDRMLMTSLKEFIEKENVREVVVGESKGPAGDNPVMRNIRFFVSELERETGLTVRYESEYMTSAEARRATPDKLVDAEAAAIILNSYIANTKGTPHDDNA